MVDAGSSLGGRGLSEAEDLIRCMLALENFCPRLLERLLGRDGLYEFSAD